MAGDTASKLSAKTNALRNTVAGRKALSPSDFALPALKKYRIDDIAHARDALSRVAQFGTSAQKIAVRNAVYRRYPALDPKNK